MSLLSEPEFLHIAGSPHYLRIVGSPTRQRSLRVDTIDLREDAWHTSPSLSSTLGLKLSRDGGTLVLTLEA